MSTDRSVSRRRFIAGAVAAGGGLALVAKQGSAFASTPAVETAPVGKFFLFDPEHADACRNIAGSAALSCANRAIAGDRVRFAADLFASESAPQVIAGASTYADFILLSGSAAEQGYRVLDESPRGALISWKLARLRRPISSG
jgi:hypothetical protein